MRRRPCLVVAAAALGALALAAPAGATVTASRITSPASPLVANAPADSGGLSYGVLSGTVTAAANDPLALACRHGGATVVSPAVGVAGADGTFTVPLAAPIGFDPRRCDPLAVVPAGFAPADSLGPFAGIVTRLGVTYRYYGGPGGGTLTDDFIAQDLARGYADFGSLGNAGLDDVDTYSGPTSSPTLLFGNAQLDLQDAPAENAQIDGRAAYAPGAAELIDDATPTLPALTLTGPIVPNADGMSFSESDPFVRCPTDVTAPTAQSCPAFTRTGITADRAAVVSAGGRVIAFTDTFRSTDGAAHTLSLPWGQRFYASTTGYRIGSETTYAGHIDGDVAPPQAGPWTLAAIYDRSAAPSLANPVATITSDVSASFLFRDTDDLRTTQALRVPAGGSATVRWTFAQSNSQSEVDAAAAAARARYATPVPTTTTPAPPAATTTVTTPAVTTPGPATTVLVPGAPVPVAGRVVTVTAPAAPPPAAPAPLELTVLGGSAQRQRLARTGAATVSVRCSLACAVTATPRLTVGSAKVKALKPVKAAARAGAITKLPITLGTKDRAAVRRALRARRKVTLRVALAATAGAARDTAAVTITGRS